jgi:hypothetical protein
MVTSSDGSLTAENTTYQWHAQCCEALEKMNIDHQPGAKMKGWCDDVGFESVKEEIISIPLGVWPKDKKYVCLFPVCRPLVPFSSASKEEQKTGLGMYWLIIEQKEIGAWNYLIVTEGLEALSLRLFTKVLGWRKEEVETLCAKVRSELKTNKKIHPYYK